MSIQNNFVPLQHQTNIGEKNMRKVNQLLKEIEPIRAEINKRCIAYLKRVLKKAENHRIGFYDEENGEYIGGEVVCVTYDGGNHPEYARGVRFVCIQRIVIAMRLRVSHGMRL